MEKRSALTASRFQSLVQEIFRNRMRKLLPKIHDYSGTDNVLGSFQRVTTAVAALEIPQSEIYGDAAYHVIRKLDKILHLVRHRNGKTEFESIPEIVAELHTYVDYMLAAILHREESRQTNKNDIISVEDEERMVPGETILNEEMLSEWR